MGNCIPVRWTGRRRGSSWPRWTSSDGLFRGMKGPSWRRNCSYTVSPTAVNGREATEVHQLERCDAGFCPCLSWAFHRDQDDDIPLSDLLEDMCCSQCGATGERTASTDSAEDREEALVEDSWPEEDTTLMDFFISKLDSERLPFPQPELKETAGLPQNMDPWRIGPFGWGNDRNSLLESDSGFVDCVSSLENCRLALQDEEE
ncbi:uncharacterized protein [Ambystoma mexicanum]|uniref:uncharacterized protein n=1 Tax=Ambystoma mexicanum TaxID=8296 RepID=UPI0037E8EEA6